MHIAIAVEGCVAHEPRMRSIRETWAKESPIPVLCFTGPVLGVPDDYDSLPLKTKAICKLCRNMDYILKCDTDTYISIPRLMESGFADYDYSGYVLDSYEIPYCAGPAYWLSRKCLNILASANWSDYHSSHPECEDVMVGTILNSHGIKPHHDERYSHFVPVLPGNNIISYHLKSRQAFRDGMIEEAHRGA